MSQARPATESDRTDMDIPNLTATSPAPARLLRDRKGQPYEPAIGPALRVLLFFLFITFAVLGATAIYLTSIRAMEEIKGQFYQSLFSLWMFAVHQWVGVAFVVPFFVFGLIHLATARRRKNGLAVRLGILLFSTGSLVVVSGLALMQIPGLPQLPTGDVSTLGLALPWRAIVLWLHGLLPVAAVWIYVMHRRAGPAIKWRYGYAWGVGVVAFVGAMLFMHSHDPRKWYAQGSPEGEKYFEPSRARTVDANFIPAQVLMADEYCLKCHGDIYKSHLHSAHRFSSFNNPAYLFSVRETRRTVGVRASRWCAGCHDPVPFFSGQFDDPNFDDVNNPTAHAGITCTTCHSMTHINSRSGNGDYTIEEPIHYPFTFSDSPVLGWLNEQLVKAKPEFHKRTFLKPFHRTAEFCSVCHKVGLPQEVNHYKEFLRGQDHLDTYHLSGVSGHGARSFYYPKQAKTNCAQCHMPLMESDDFGSRDFDGSGKRTVHNHMFPSANTGVAALVKYRGHEEVIKAHEKFLQGGPDGKSPPLRIDLFGLKRLTEQHPGVDAPLLDDKPLRPNLPRLQPGGTYLAEVVVRTLNMGHPFTQGTADSNEVWVDFQVHAKKPDGTRRLLARNGGMDGGEDVGRVDPWAHFINVLMLDRHGNRIDRRNPQDIFTPLYNHQIPPGAASVIHYRLEVPRDLKPGESVELSARVRYRKFDHRYMEIIRGSGKVPRLPIVDMCSDRVELPVAGLTEKVPPQESPIKPAWQRWNDYGIGCFLEGGPDGKKGGELAQAERSFNRLVDERGEFRDVKEAHSHGWLNLARVHVAYAGVERLDLARQALSRARKSDPPAPWQTVAWFNGLVDLENGNLDEAAEHFKTILDPKNRDPKRGFDFTQDFVVINKLGQTYFLRSRQPAPDSEEERQDLLAALAEFEKTLKLDPDNVEAHEFLNKCYRRLGGKEALAPLVRDETSKTESRLLNLVDTLAARAQPTQRRLDAARELAALARQLEEQPRFEVLLEARRRAWSAAKEEDPWLRTAVTPALRELDRRILAALPGLAKTFADSGQERGRRLQAAADLAAGLAEVEERPPPADVGSPLLTAASFPRPGLPVNLTLAGLGDRGQLQGPLPQPRLLTLYSVRQQVRPLFLANGDRELQRAAARVLGRVHLTMHGIFKPDDNASGQAVELYRRRHPPAALASQSIAIYPAHPGGRPPRP